MEDGLKDRALVEEGSVGKLLHYFINELMRFQSKTAAMGRDRKS